MYKQPKYKNKKIEVDGIQFDSRKEARRYTELKLQEKAGGIHDLELQRKFVVIPAQYDLEGHTATGKPILKCAERECAYIADFCYRDKEDVLHVEDVKSPLTKTPQYIIKRKLMRYVHGIKIEEV